MAVKDILFTEGFMTLVRDDGAPTKYAIADVLRALDIPAGLTHEQVGAITTLANHFFVLIRTLIARNVLDEDFLEEGEYPLSVLVQSLEDMGGDFGEPDLTVT